MKTKKYHFGKRWAIRDKSGWFETIGTHFTKNIIDAKVYTLKREAKRNLSYMPDWRKAKLVTIKETVYVVEL